MVRTDGKPLTSPITSHVLDTSRGCPAQGVHIALERKAPGSSDIWEAVGRGVTNADGRVPTMMTPSATVQPGVYRQVPELLDHHSVFLSVRVLPDDKYG